MFAVELNVKDNNYQFKKTKIKLNRLALELEGGFNYKDSLQDISVNYKAPNLDIASVLSLLPETYKNKINDYDNKGSFYASGNIKYSGKNAYTIESAFGIKQGEITYKPKSTQATNVNVEGYLKYSNAVSQLELKNVFLKLNNDEIKGNCSIHNFSDPQLKVNLQAAINLQNLQNFCPSTHLPR